MMNILPLGDCNHAQASEGTHIKSTTIKELAKEMRIIKNMPDSNASARGTKTQQLLLIKDNINRCINTVRNDLIRHNSNKLPQLEKLLEEAQRALTINTFKRDVKIERKDAKEADAAKDAASHQDDWVMCGAGPSKA